MRAIVAGKSTTEDFAHRTELLLRRFLQAGRGFALHLVDYIEATRFIDDVHRSFEVFCRSIAQPAPAAPWEQNRLRFRTGVEGIPAYAAIDWTQSSYWQSIPFTDKDSIRSDAQAFLSPKFHPDKLWRRRTSGTTGAPVTIFYAPEFFVDYHLYADCKVAWLAGLLTDDVRNRDIFCLAPADRKLVPDRVWGSPNGFRGLTVRPAFDERDSRSIRRVIELLEELRPAILALKPNILECLLRAGPISKFGKTDLRMIISSGSDLDDGLRRDAHAAFGVPVVNAYGMTELGIVASECALHEGLHLYEAEVIAEVLDAEGNLSTSGRGELVVSTVSNRAMPLLRYKTGDLVEITSQPCRCGKMGRRIVELSGRLVPTFTLTDGSEFAPTNFDCLFSLFPLEEFRLTQTNLDHFLLEVRLTRPVTASEPVLRSIAEHVRRELRFLAQVEVRTADFEAAGKFQRYRMLVASRPSRWGRL